MVVGTIIGASIFVQPSLVSGAVPSIGGVLLVWAAAGALTLIGALVTAELASAFPETGGVYVFLRRAYTPAVAYLWGWAMFWVMHSGIIAAIATVFARYLGQIVGLSDVGARVAAVGAILVLSVVNYVGVRHGSALQTGFTAIKVIAVAAIVAIGCWYAVTHGRANLGIETATTSAGGFVEAMVAGLFAYGGWHMVTYSAGETRDAARTIPRALLIGTTVVTLTYIAVNAAYLAVLPLAQVTSSTRVAADFADASLGPGSGNALAVLVMLSALGAMTGIILAGPRVYQTMAADGLLFRWVAAVHPRYRTPHRAIALQAVWSCVLVLTGSYRSLVTSVVYTEWVFFALMAASVFLLRRRADYSPSYRVWGYPVLPAIFVLASAIIVVHRLVAQPARSLGGLTLVAAGLPIYWFWTRRRRASRPS